MKAQPMEQPTRTFTPEEWEAIVKADPVLAFVARVTAAAKARKDWPDNYARALCDALDEEHGRYAIEKYNAGEPFRIMAYIIPPDS